MEQMKNELADKINTLEQMKSRLKDNVGGTSEQMEDIKNILSTLAACKIYPSVADLATILQGK